jgi:hypothetical protein
MMASPATGIFRRGKYAFVDISLTVPWTLHFDVPVPLTILGVVAAKQRLAD